MRILILSWDWNSEDQRPFLRSSAGSVCLSVCGEAAHPKFPRYPSPHPPVPRPFPLLGVLAGNQKPSPVSSSQARYVLKKEFVWELETGPQKGAVESKGMESAWAWGLGS